tara:strand:- start:363 stop:923 length:561 start_codon:yes stop_codon:yes gene_type:complete
MEEIEIETFEGVYEPAEDSWMVCNYLPNELGSALEIGCGSGILSIHLAKKGNQVTSIDINPKAVKATIFNAKQNQVEIEVLEGNMFDKVKGRKFDFIVCNPPYLPPTDKYDDPELALAVEGGPTGSEFTIEFLSKADKYLKENGNVYLIVSSKMENLEVDWERKIIHKESFFFERLTLERFSKFKN